MPSSSFRNTRTSHNKQRVNRDNNPVRRLRDDGRHVTAVTLFSKQGGFEVISTTLSPLLEKWFYIRTIDHNHEQNSENIKNNLYCIILAKEICDLFHQC